MDRSVSRSHRLDRTARRTENEIVPGEPLTKSERDRMLRWSAGIGAISAAVGGGTLVALPQDELVSWGWVAFGAILFLVGFLVLIVVAGAWIVHLVRFRKSP